MDKISIQNYKSPVGELIVGAIDEKICLCDWRYRKRRSSVDKRITANLKASYVEENNPIITEAIKQLDEYFIKKRKEFTIPLELVGTDFQKKVWRQLLKIPIGTAISYLELSKELGDEKAIRAVASANGANAISIIVPCHRVIGSYGNLIGYAGGLSAKKSLLKLEGFISNDTQLKLFD